MQKNIDFTRKNISRFMFFCFLFFFISSFIFAKNSYILSPVEGQWSNYQSIVIDVPEGATAFYSFTGDNPLYSGFAYESPVLLELEGNVNLKVVILNKDDSVIEESVNFSVNKKPLNVSFYKDTQTQALITLSENNIAIPSYMRFAFGDDKNYFLKENHFQLIQKILWNKFYLYRFKMKIIFIDLW